MVINKKIIQEKIDNLYKEAKQLLEEDEIEWQDEFLNYRDYSPNFEEFSENSKYFYIVIGKIESLQEILNLLK